MNSTEFVIWLKGFVAASNNYNLTPGGWETLKSELEKVDVKSSDVNTQDLNDLYVDTDCECTSPNDALIQAAQKYKEWLEQIDKSDRPTWYTTTTKNVKK
jgi:hypothetical protein